MVDNIPQLIQEHKQFFHNDYTRSLQFRLEQLEKLKKSIQKYENEVLSALYQDLHKSEFEAYAAEIGFAFNSINFIMKYLKRWMKPQKVKTPMHFLPSKSYIIKEPYGTVLIIGPFNYPFQSLIEPLIGAIAGGNCVVLKPSENAPNVAAVINKIIGETFDKRYIRVIEGDRETTSLLIHAPFDYIFFTGSVQVGKIVMEAAAKNLVPVTLELGGKAPAIVDETANLDIAAKRIIWGKFINAGQSCIAPDYVIVHKSVKGKLISKMKEIITSFYGSDVLKSNDYGRIINERQFDRLISILEQDRNYIVFGGNSSRSHLYIEPTILEVNSWDAAAMKEEIFGPILPIMDYNDLDEVIHMVNNQPKPLALYVFTENKNVEKQVLGRISFGGGCVNDTMSHMANLHLPFGGVGNAGFGAYHGKHSFDAFTHHKSILKKSSRVELGLVFPPYRNKIEILRKIFK
ncbi:aldehyde dehydrogenase [Bacillus cereus]|uniref:aldehyde dehydrogenase n=1 Tax=unclassified Bacillus (in: firmicutes) TaxID=185979 RepID=UPI00047A23E9|nr:MULTISPECIES: aldehyde dehydrogenase [unclassified Bacillus (in: firmicutes)]PFE01276.1 aldehyde dehydrogenase [Bacillus sp. AFS023182]PGX96768.1 aldehyde dehydrogenase [Bacillus cereus]